MLDCSAVDTLVRLIAVLVVGYLAVCAALYLLQDQMIFYPRGLTEHPRGPHVDALTLERDGVTLRGWLVNGGSSGPLVVYFGGNAEEVSGLVDVFARLDARTVLINYRGFGESEGTPSAQHAIADARALIAQSAALQGPPRPLILFGRSIGSGIAVVAADAADVDGMILLSPYRSLERLARRVVPFVPVGLLLRHRIDPGAHAQSLPERVLVLYSVTDRVIPPEESRAFVDLLSSPPQLVALSADHDVPLTDPDLWPHVERFVATYR
jgi:uncharacterized protein